MLGRRAVIEISPTRLELGVLRAGAPSAIRSESHVSQPGESWEMRLEAVSARLREWGVKTGLAGTAATVLYTGGDGVATVVSCAASITGSARRSAALLALADRVNFPLEGQPAEVQILARDPARSSDSPQAHMLAAADTDQSLSALTGAIQSAGFRLAAVAPASAAEIATAVQVAIERSRRGKPTMILRFGEHASVLAAAESGRICFVRTFSIGAEVLAEAMSGALHGAGVDGARRVLYRVGIPLAGDVVDEKANVTGRTVLPLVQPVLQRCIVEIKQSLRFGLGNRDGVELLIDGFGGRIPRLGHVLAEAVGLTPTAEPVTGASVDTPASSDCGAIAALSAYPSLSLSLLPAQMAGERASRRLQVMMGVGAIAAAAFVGVDGFIAHVAANDLEGQIVQLEAQSERDSALHAKQQSAIDRIVSTRDAQRRLAGALGETPDWAGALAFVSSATPGHIRLDRIELAEEETGAVCRLSGRVRLTDAANGSAEIRRYVDALGDAPIARSVHLGATGRIETERGAEQHFELTIDLVELPAEHHFQRILAATEESP